MQSLVTIDDQKTIKFFNAVDGKGTLLQEIKKCPYTCASKMTTNEECNLWLFGTESGQLVTYDIRKRQEVTVFAYPKQLEAYDEQTSFQS